MPARLPPDERAVAEPSRTTESHTRGQALSAYLLGTLSFDVLLAHQRRLVYDIGGDNSRASLILCDHPPGITIGREGSRCHVRPSPEELNARGWSVRWVSRGGGVMLHLPGQVACYPLLPLRSLGFAPGAYVEQLQLLGLDLLRDFGVSGEIDTEHPGVLVGGRRLIHIGVAIRANVACFGLIVNADPDLEPFRDIRCDGDRAPMTSLARESSHRVRVGGVRQRLLELIRARFGFDRVSIFHTPPPGALSSVGTHASAHRS
jgi:lipoyl(octanoyl) transferase